MPWSTPTLKDVRKLTRDYVLSQLGARAMIANSVLRIMSDAMSGLAHLTLLYVDWLSKQLLPDTAETEWLDRHGHIWLVNADGSTGRKVATYAKGEVLFTGVTGTIIPSGSLLNGANGVQYQTAAQGVVGTNGANVAAVALTAGAVGNMPDGDPLALVDQIVGVDNVVFYGEMTGGTDTETDEQLRERVLRRIQQPPMGGAEHDYEAWALAVPGVTRAWAYGNEMGIGTVTVRFMMDDLRADNGGFPLPDDVLAVETYINMVRPVTVKDTFVVAPIPQPVDFEIVDLSPDTPDVRGEIEAAAKQMLFDYAEPGQTIFGSWKVAAVQETPGVKSFSLGNVDNDVMQSPGHMATLGDIHYSVTPPLTVQPPGLFNV